MSTVSLRFGPIAEHVRTARLVAVSVARRAGLAEDQLDAVRLSVGEMCARSVRRCADAGVGAPMLVEIDDSGARFEVVVTDSADAPEGDDEYVALALVRDLADDMDLTDGPGGTGGRVRLVWDRASR